MARICFELDDGLNSRLKDLVVRRTGSLKGQGELLSSLVLKALEEEGI